MYKMSVIKNMSLNIKYNYVLFYKRVCHAHTYAVSVCGVRILG